MKHPLLIAFFLIYFFIPESTYSEIPPEGASKVYKVGVSTVLTGEAATYGFDLRDILTFANVRLGQGKFRLIFEDDMCSAREAAIAAQKFVDVDKVDFVVGYACSTAALAATPILNRAKIPVIVVFASSPKISNVGEYVFRTTPSDSQAAEVLFNHIQKKQRSIAALSELSDYAQDLKAAFINANQHKLLEIIAIDYLPGTTDFKAILTKLKFQKPEAIFINTQAESTYAVILRQIRELAWNVPIYGAYWPGSPALIDAAKSDLDGVEFVDVAPVASVLSAEGANVYREYVEKYGKPRSAESVFVSTYEAFHALAQAVQNGSDVTKFLGSTQFNGVFGNFSFDSNGDIVGLPFVMKRVEKGVVSVIAPKTR